MLPDGSSPRVWGTRSHLDHRCPIPRFIPTCVGNTKRLGEELTEFGFIPTCVGNTPSSRGADQTRAVHPHVCGEHRIPMIVPLPAYGSSPRVWGTPSWRRVRVEELRFIPTCVGNTRPCHLCRLCHPVHPHVCGEHARSPTDKHRNSGSSPRVWGTLRTGCAFFGLIRFIPTCVGNTLARAISS